MDYSSHITFDRIDEVQYEVYDSNRDIRFVGDLDDCLGVYNAWSNGTAEPFELEYFSDWTDGNELEIHIEFDEDDED